MIKNLCVNGSTPKVLITILILLCLLGAGFFIFLSITSPDAYTQITPSNRYSQVLTPLESALYKDVTSLSEAHKLFFPIKYINQKYQLVLNWNAEGGNGKYTSLRNRVIAYNIAIVDSYRGFSLVLTAMVYIYLLSLIAAIKIYHGTWVKLSIFVILGCSLLTFPAVSESIREQFVFFRFWNVPFYWTLPLIVITVALVVSSWFCKQKKTANNDNIKWDKYTNIAIVLLIVSSVFFVDNLASDLIKELYREFAFFRALVDADIWNILFYTAAFLALSILIILTILSLGASKKSEFKTDECKKHPIHQGARSYYYFIALSCIILIVGIPLSLWIFYRLRSMRIEISLTRILVVRLTTKQYKVSDIANLAIYQAKTPLKNSGIAEVSNRLNNQGNNLIIGLIFEIIFEIITSIFVSKLNGHEKYTYILTKDKNDKVSKIHISAHENEEMIIREIEKVSGKTAVQLTDNTVNDWMKVT